MKKDYWNVNDVQVLEKTGKRIFEWIRILNAFKATEKKSDDVVAYLQMDYNVPGHWACILTTFYFRLKNGNNILLVPFG